MKGGCLKRSGNSYWKPEFTAGNCGRNVFIELNSVSNVSNGVASPLSDVTTITVKIQEIL